MHIGTQDKRFVFFSIMMRGKCLVLTLESEIIVEFCNLFIEEEY